jgi:hypothetical protein
VRLLRPMDVERLRFDEHGRIAVCGAEHDAQPCTGGEATPRGLFASPADIPMGATRQTSKATESNLVCQHISQLVHRQQCPDRCGAARREVVEAPPMVI